MKSFRFKLYKSDKNAKLHKQINAAGLIYNHCIAIPYNGESKRAFKGAKTVNYSDLKKSELVRTLTGLYRTRSSNADAPS